MALDAVAQRSGVCSTSAACHTQNLRGVDQWRGSRASLAALQRLSRSTGHRKGGSKRNMSCTKAQATATALSTERQPGKWSSMSPRAISLPKSEAVSRCTPPAVRSI